MSARFQASKPAVLRGQSGKAGLYPTEWCSYSLSISAQLSVYDCRMAQLIMWTISLNLAMMANIITNDDTAPSSFPAIAAGTYREI
jgi:hypothetical protein